MTAGEMAARLGARRCGSGWMARCPNTAGHANGDRHPSLSISEGRDGRTLLRCFACGDTPAIMAAIGLQWADIFPPDSPRPQRRTTKPQALNADGEWAAWCAAMIGGRP
jgi:hypothetical protein